MLGETRKGGGGRGAGGRKGEGRERGKEREGEGGGKRWGKGGGREGEGEEKGGEEGREGEGEGEGRGRGKGGGGGREGEGEGRGREKERELVVRTPGCTISSGKCIAKGFYADTCNFYTNKITQEILDHGFKIKRKLDILTCRGHQWPNPGYAGTNPDLPKTGSINNYTQITLNPGSLSQHLKPCIP